MIKINLLPKTINEKRIIRSIAILMGVIFVAVVAAGLTFNMKLTAKSDDMEKQATDAEARKTHVDGINSETQSVVAKTKPIKTKTDFINDVLEYNVKVAELYEQITRWAYEKVEYRSLQFNGTNVRMQARVKSLDDLGRYLLNMYRATDLFTQVTIDGVPGYPRKSRSLLSMAGYYGGYDQAAPYDLAGIGAITTGIERKPEDEWIDFTVDCTLRVPISPPTIEGQPAQGMGQRAGMAGRPPMPGMMPGMPGAPPGMMPGGPPGMMPGPPMPGGR